MVPDADRSAGTFGRSGGTSSWLSRLSVGERRVWSLALAALVADLALTRYGLARGLTEVNPVGAAALEAAGIAGLGLLKLVALGVAVVGRAAVPERFRVLLPAVLACVWGAAAVVNAAVILVVA